MNSQFVTCPICETGARYDFSGRDLMFGLFRRHDYYFCPECHCVFQYPMPDLNEIISFYPPDYCVYAEDNNVPRIGAWRQAILREYRGYNHLSVGFATRALVKLLSPLVRLPGTPNFSKDGLLLDVGCGNGRYLLAMQNLGWNVQGIEFNNNGVDVCRKSGLKVHHGDLHSARFSSGSFDLITVRHVIEHIPDPHSFIAELSRLLKPGGRLLISTPNSNALGRQWFKSCWFHNDVPRHLILYSPDNLIKLCEKHGFRKGEIIFETTQKAFLNSVDYLIDNRTKPSRRIAWRRLLARIYIVAARSSKRSDTLQVVFSKV